MHWQWLRKVYIVCERINRNCAVWWKTKRHTYSNNLFMFAVDLKTLYSSLKTPPTTAHTHTRRQYRQIAHANYNELFATYGGVCVRKKERCLLFDGRCLLLYTITHTHKRKQKYIYHWHFTLKHVVPYLDQTAFKWWCIIIHIISLGLALLIIE